MSQEIHVHATIQLAGLEDVLHIKNMLAHLIRLSERTHMSLDEINAKLDGAIAEIASQSTREDSILTFIASIEQQLADALAGANLPAETQARIDAVFTGLQANSVKLDKALNTNVPPAVV